MPGLGGGASGGGFSGGSRGGSSHGGGSHGGGGGRGGGGLGLSGRGNMGVGRVRGDGLERTTGRRGTLPPEMRPSKKAMATASFKYRKLKDLISMIVFSSISVFMLILSISAGLLTNIGSVLIGEVPLSLNFFKNVFILAVFLLVAIGLPARYYRDYHKH